MTAATVTEGFQTSLIVDEKKDEKDDEKEDEKEAELRNGKMSRHFTPLAIRRLVSLRRRVPFIVANSLVLQIKEVGNCIKLRTIWVQSAFAGQFSIVISGV